MANLIFKQCDKSDIDSNLECYVNDKNQIYILIEHPRHLDQYAFISLDIPTAIQFKRHLAHEIAKAKEAQNG